jgi:TRAP-type transport system small permease protein
VSQIAAAPAAAPEEGVVSRLRFPPSPRSTGQVLRWVLLNFEEIVTASLIGFMIGLVTLSVFVRYALNRPFSFTEEVVLVCMVWVCFLGACIAAKDREHIVIDIVLAIVPKPVSRAMETFSLVVTIILLAILVWQGLILVERTQFMQTTALQLPVGVMYIAIPVSSALMIVHNVGHLYRDLRAGRGRVGE